ncbi:hypothetical protein AVEN_72526-1, partial [Araneus ventricosus]
MINHNLKSNDPKTQLLNKWMALRRSLRRRANRDPSPMETVSSVDNHDQKPTSRSCGHGAMQMLKVSWKYVEKSTRRVISRIQQCGPTKKDLYATRRARPRHVRSARSSLDRPKRHFAQVQKMWDLTPDKLAAIILDGE